MKRILGVVAAGGLWLGMTSAANAQFSLSVGNPYTGGFSIGAPYVGAYSGYYGVPYTGLGYPYTGLGYPYTGLGYGVVPGASYYSSGYYGLAPGVAAFAAPYNYGAYYGVPAYGVRSFGFAPYRYGYYGGFRPGFRRGWVGGIW
jgi:hypothetical protein